MFPCFTVMPSLNKISYLILSYLWSLALRTHSLIFVGHLYVLLCFLFSYKHRSYVFSIIVSYHSCQSKSSDVERFQKGYSHGTIGVHLGYNMGTMVVAGVLSVTTSFCSKV